MKYHRILTFGLCCLLFIGYFSFWQTADRLKAPSKKHFPVEANPAWKNVVEYAREHLPAEGVLTMKSDGFVYLKVDDKYIHTLFPMLELRESGFYEPPYFRAKEAPGAHISIFYVDEHILPTEIGQTFHFKLKDIVVVKTAKGDSHAVLVVDAPELEKLREKYGFSPKLQGHEYHITLAKKTPHPRHS